MSRYIDADKLNIDFYDEYETEDDAYAYAYVSMYQIETAPSIDIVRCRECCGYNTDGYRDGCGFCFYHQSVVKADDFCSYGEREGE